MICPEHDVLVALGDGELPESRAQALRAHADRCTRCRAELDELVRLSGDLRAPVRGALGGRDAEAFADDVLAKLDRPRAATGGPRAARWLAFLAAAVVPLSIVLVYNVTRGGRGGDEWTARGASTNATTAQRAVVRFGHIEGRTFEPLAEGSTLEADALVAAEVGGTDGAPRYLLAFLVDAAGDRHWIYPSYEVGAPPPSAVALPATVAPKVLGSMVRLDHPAAGAARLFAIVLPRVETVEHVEHAPIERLTRAQLALDYPDALVIAIPVEVR